MTMDPQRIAEILKAAARTKALMQLGKEVGDISPATLRVALEEASRLIEQMAPPRRAAPSGEGCLIIHIDGAARGNPGPAGIGVVMRDEAGSFREELQISIGEATNNVAEYEALLFACRKAKELGYTAVKIFSDSELLVRQIRGEYRVKSPRLRELYAQAQLLLSSFGAVEVNHIHRGMNTRADLLANRAIDAALAERGQDFTRPRKGQR